MGNDLTVPVKKLISELEPEFNSIASYDKEKFQRESVFAFQQLAKGIDSKNKKTRESAEYKLRLAQQNPMALKFAVLGVASLNLTFEPNRAEAYLVPRDGQIALNVGYRGLTKIAISEGAISWCQPAIVRKNDKFKWINSWTAPVHEESNPFNESERGEIIGVYCAYKTGSEILFDKMSISEVYKIRDRSDSWKNEKARPYSPWHPLKSETEMIKKTIVRRVSKSWHAGAKFAEAIQIVDQNDGIDFEREKEEEIRGELASNDQINEITELVKKLGRTEEQFVDFFRTMTRDDLTLSNIGSKEAEKAIKELNDMLSNALTKKAEREQEDIEAQADMAMQEEISQAMGNDNNQPTFTTNDIEF